MDATNVAKNVLGTAFHIFTKAEPISFNIGVAFGRRNNRRSIASQTCAIGDRSGEKAGYGRKL